MAKATSPIPAGYHTLTPYLAVNDGLAAIAFYQKACPQRAPQSRLFAFGTTVLVLLDRELNRVGWPAIHLCHEPQKPAPRQAGW